MKKAIGRIYHFTNKGRICYFAEVSVYYKYTREKFTTRVYTTKASLKRRANAMAKKWGWTVEWGKE